MRELLAARHARAVFERELIAAHGLEERYRLTDCRIVRVKYRPATNCVITYRLKVVDLSARRESDLLVTALACGKGESRWLFENAEKLPSVPTLIGRGIHHLPALEAVVWVFPNDRKLPGLPALADPARLRNDLLPQVVANLGEQWEITAHAGEVIRYVAERAGTARVTVALRNIHTGETASRTLFGKTYCSQEGEFAWNGLRHLWESESRRRGELLIPQPLAYQPEFKTVWQSGLEGKTLAEFASQSSHFHELLAKAGSAVAALHQTQTPFAPAITVGDIVAKLSAAENLLSRVRPACRGVLRSVVSELISSSKIIGDRPVRTLHGDLHLKNFFVTDDRVALIDLDNLSRGDPLQDVGSFLAALYYRGLLEDETFAETGRTVRPFIESYRARVDWEVSASALNWQIAAALIYERASRCVTRMKAGGPTILDDLIGLAQLVQREDVS
jgi:tRNA A-37 threonylcarbamoyl transferase component Bud32